MVEKPYIVLKEYGPCQAKLCATFSLCKFSFIYGKYNVVCAKERKKIYALKNSVLEKLSLDKVRVIMVRHMQTLIITI